MFTWAKQQLANAVGTEEPLYGPSAIRTVDTQCDERFYTEATAEHLKWTLMTSTSVETQTFYVITESGHIAMAQVIYSSVAGIRTICQFNVKVHHVAAEMEPLWTTDTLEDWKFDENKYNLQASKCSVEFSEADSSYTIKSTANPNSILDMKIRKIAPGYLIGKDGTSYYGTDHNNPWGRVRHAFWPRCEVEGSLMTKKGPIKLNGRGTFVHALQGMKPHHAVARWNFAIMHCMTHSFLFLEYTTPPSYGSTTISSGSLSVDGKLIIAGPTTAASHTETKEDTENGWPQPTAARFTLNGVTKADKASSAEIKGNLGGLADKVDVMAEVPGFVKQIVAGAVGTKPYIYQYAPKLPLEINIEGEKRVEEGQMLVEATFIC